MADYGWYPVVIYCKRKILLMDRGNKRRQTTRSAGMHARSTRQRCAVWHACEELASECSAVHSTTSAVLRPPGLDLISDRVLLYLIPFGAYSLKK